MKSKQILSLDEREGDDYLRPVLYIVSISALIIGGAITIMAFIAGWFEPMVVISIVPVSSLVLLWLVRHGSLRLPRLAFPLLVFGVSTLLAATNSGLRDESMFGYPLAIVLAGLLLKKEGIVVYTLASLAIGGWLAYTDINGLIEYDLLPISYGTVGVIEAQWLLMGILLYVTVGNLTNSMAHARRKERELAESNRELHTIRTSLEEQVAERTRSAEQDRQAAEEANRALQAQMWQIAGHAELGEVMRGEQPLETLAANVVQQLCKYLDASVGALYLLEGDVLKLMGGYAYKRPEHVPDRFKLGEGLVGQAAQSKRMLALHTASTDHIADHIAVTSGLGEAASPYSLILPFMYEGRVVGVIEMGMLTPFTPAQVDFALMAMESVAVAFNTAQARERINGLLAQTQQQAKELQTQEEELRSINEELEAQAEYLKTQQGESGATRSPHE